jgi:hypothetical protein
MVENRRMLFANEADRRPVFLVFRSPECRWFNRMEIHSRRRFHWSFRSGDWSWLSSGFIREVALVIANGLSILGVLRSIMENIA